MGGGGGVQILSGLHSNEEETTNGFHRQDKHQPSLLHEGTKQQLTVNSCLLHSEVYKKL